MLERIDLAKDLHFYTNTTIDTLDYSGEGLNAGSKIVFAAAGEKKRELMEQLPANFSLPEGFSTPKISIPGVLAIQGNPYQYDTAKQEIALLKAHLKAEDLSTLPLIVLCNDAEFTAASINNLVWVTFTRSNPATDIDGVNDFTVNKHWGCNGPLIIDARKKPHHAPELIKDSEVEKKIDRMGEKGGSLYGII
jgi:4-hydroxy-3-polyprenylbenzoate decarboxylase